MASYGLTNYRRNGFASYEFIAVYNKHQVEPEGDKPFAPKVLPMSSE